MLSSIDSLSSLQNAEITLEANPENLNTTILHQYKNIGINRLSIGIQSFDSQELKILDRRHSSLKACDAILAAHEAGIKNISCDLMYEIPDQTTEIFKKSLKEAVKLPITHLSLYNLTIEPNTPFFKRRDLKLPGQEVGAVMYSDARSYLQEHDFKQYEISAFSRDNLYSQHNSGYWNGREFIGLGPSAFSYESGKRFRNFPNLSRYCKALKNNESPCDFSETLTPVKKRRELFTIGLRLTSGINIDNFEKNYGTLEDDLVSDISKLVDQKLLIKKDNHIALSEFGIFHYDTVAAELI